MADNLNQTLQEFGETFKGGMIGWTSTIEELTRVTLRTGKDYGEGFKGLTDQFKGLDVALSDVKDMLGQNIRTGVNIEGTNKQLLVDLKRLGFNIGRFMDTMGTFEQVLGFSEATTGHLADKIVDFSVKFGRSAEQLASTMQSLVEPMARMSNAFGGSAAAGFAESVIGLGAAMGPKIADQIGPVMSKFITADPEGFRRAALAGGGAGAMESPQAMISMAQGMMSRIDRLVTPGAPFTAGIAAQMFGLSQADVNILRQLANANMSQLAIAEEGMRFEQAKALATQTFTGSLNSILLDLQMGLVPVMDAINDSISIVFKVFKDIFPSFSTTAINFGEAVAQWIRDYVTNDSVVKGFDAIIGLGKSGVELFANMKVKFGEWRDATIDFAKDGWSWSKKVWDQILSTVVSWKEETILILTDVQSLFTRVFSEIDLRLSASQIAASQNGGMWGDDGWLAAMGGGGKFRQAAEQHQETGSTLSPANFFAEPQAQNLAAQQTAGTAMFADPELVEQQKLLVEAMENNTEVSNTQVRQLKQFNNRQRRIILNNSTQRMWDEMPAGGNPGGLL